MAFVVLEFRNERHRVDTTPMKKLASILEDFCHKTRTKLNPEDFELVHKKQVLDLTLPFRFANLTNGVKLELKLKEEGNEVKTGVSSSSRHKSRRVENSEPTTTALDPHDATGVREMIVYHRDALVREMDELELSDAFFEFTKEDYFRVMGSYQYQTNSILKTKAMREIEETEITSQFNDVKIRFCFPDEMIVEVKFAPSDQVSDLYTTLQTMIKTSIIAPLVLFTAPPKSVLKEMDLTLFKAKLLPAANLFVGFKDQAPDGLEGLLKDELMAQQIKEVVVEGPKMEVELPEKEETKEVVPNQRTTDPEKKIPKWFKMKGPK